VVLVQPASQIDSNPPRSNPDQRVMFRGVSWAQYEAMLEIRGENAVPRMTYLEGDLELMAPSISHESLKKCLARLVEAYAEAFDIALEGYGSWTLKRQKLERGLEPDECYVLGTAVKEVPDLAIEVVWTSGGVDKLPIYARLGVPEVWIYEEGRLRMLRLDNQQYVAVARSQLLPQFDPALIAQAMSCSSQTEAVRRLRAEIAR
jgi:Uma2 family endonuclease